eukprot:SAG31_NODE_533_length_14371_cov_6.455367_9_plen_129_part_00
MDAGHGRQTAERRVSLRGSFSSVALNIIRDLVAPHRYEFQLHQVVGFEGLHDRVALSKERVDEFHQVLRVRAAVQGSVTVRSAFLNFAHLFGRIKLGQSFQTWTICMLATCKNLLGTNTVSKTWNNKF